MTHLEFVWIAFSLGLTIIALLFVKEFMRYRRLLRALAQMTKH